MGTEDSTWKDAVVTSLGGTETGASSSKKLAVKELRNIVLLSMQLDIKDKQCKKKFKKVIQQMESDGMLSLNADGIVKLMKKKKKNKEKKKDQETNKDKKAKNTDKKKRKSTDTINAEESDDDDSGEKSHKKRKKDDGTVVKEENADLGDEDDVMPQQHHQQQHSQKKDNTPCKGNPQGVTRLFVGNLPFSVDEASLQEFFSNHEDKNASSSETVTHIKWITDKETGKFYGSAFLEMDTSQNAARAVAMAGKELMGRPIKVNFAPSRPGDVWPPPKKVITGGSITGGGTTTTGGQAGGVGIKAMSEKPENCTKLFIGNLSYDIDDEGITKFFANVEAEVKAVRWIHHKDSGDFKGVGFVEFWNTSACEKAATLNGKVLLGRSIRIDWTD